MSLSAARKKQLREYYSKLALGHDCRVGRLHHFPGITRWGNPAYMAYLKIRFNPATRRYRVESSCLNDCQVRAVYERHPVTGMLSGRRLDYSEAVNYLARIDGYPLDSADRAFLATLDMEAAAARQAIPVMGDE